MDTKTLSARFATSHSPWLIAAMLLNKLGKRNKVVGCHSDLLQAHLRVGEGGKAVRQSSNSQCSIVEEHAGGALGAKVFWDGAYHGTGV
jgi:hypothetical protein